MTAAHGEKAGGRAYVLQHGEHVQNGRTRRLKRARPYPISPCENTYASVVAQRNPTDVVRINLQTQGSSGISPDSLPGWTNLPTFKAMG